MKRIITGLALLLKAFIVGYYLTDRGIDYFRQQAIYLVTKSTRMTPNNQLELSVLPRELTRN